MTTINFYEAQPAGPSMREQLRELIQQGFADEMALVARLNEAQREEIGAADHWSAKDLLSHLSTWKQRLTHSLAVTARGETPPTYEHGEQLNAEDFERNRYLSWEDVLVNAERIHDELITQVDRYGNADLTTADRYPWLNGTPLWKSIAGNGYYHPQTHLALYYVAHGRTDRADQMQERMVSIGRVLDESPTAHGTAVYNLACYYATTNRPERALELLGKAFGLRPDLAAYSRNDSDLSAVRELPGYATLT